VSLIYGEKVNEKADGSTRLISSLCSHFIDVEKITLSLLTLLKKTITEWEGAFCGPERLTH